MRRRKGDASARSRRGGNTQGDPNGVGNGAIDPELDPEVDEIVNAANPANRLRDWLAHNAAAADCELDVSLYKFNSPTEGRAKAFCWRGSDVLDEVEIGRRFGSGRYLQIVIVPRGSDGKRKINSATFYLHESFDRQATQPQPAGAEPGGAASLAAAMGLVREVVSMFLPLIAAQRQGSAPGTDFGAMMLKQYDLMGQAMNKNMLDTQKMVRQAVMRGLPATADEVDEGEEEAETAPPADTGLSQILQLAQEWLPKLLGNGPQADALATIVKASPQLTSIRADAAKYVRLVQALDNEHGPEVVDQILAKLGLARPGR